MGRAWFKPSSHPHGNVLPHCLKSIPSKDSSPIYLGIILPQISLCLTPQPQQQLSQGPLFLLPALPSSPGSIHTHGPSLCVLPAPSPRALQPPWHLRAAFQGPQAHPWHWKEKQTQSGKEQAGFRQKKAQNKRGTTAGQGIEVYSSVASRNLGLV